MRPTSFMSKKFTNAQRSYFTYEHETLGVIEALKKWDDILLGLPEIKVVTDHQALKTEGTCGTSANPMVPMVNSF